jgi:hypothetical protein
MTTKATLTLATGRPVFSPPCIAQARSQDMLYVDGLARGGRWDGLTATMEELGIDAPAAAPTFAATGSGNSSAADYQAAYRFTDDTLPTGIPSNLSEIANVTATINQKFTYTALSAAVAGGQRDRVKYVEIYRGAYATALERADPLYLVVQLGASGTITSAANNGGTFRFTVPAGHNLLAGARITISGATGAGAGDVNATHEISAVAATTLDVTTSYTSDATGGTWVLEGYMSDTLSDASLQANDPLIVTNVDGTLSAYRFVPPPDFKAVVAFIQDRAWYAVDVYYNEGTVTTNGTTTLEGSGTAWTTAMAGRYVYIEGETKPYVVASVTDSNTLVLTEAAVTSAAGLTYTIAPSPDEKNKLYFSEVDEPESVSRTNDVIVQENTGDNDFITGLMPYGSALYVLKERHVYRLTFARQPRIDVSVSLVAWRGCVNHRCWAIWQGQGFLLDADGVWRFGAQGGGVDEVGGPIADLWRDDTLDWTKSKWWFTSINHDTGDIEWHVSYVGDTGTRPKRGIVFNVPTKAWSTTTYDREIGGACNLPITPTASTTQVGGDMRRYFAAEDDQTYLADYGLTDGIDGYTEFTATSATATTVTKTSAGWTTNGFRHASLSIISGTGKGQTRKITSNTSDTLTVPTWTTNPDSTSVLVVGAIPWTWRSGTFRVLSSEDASTAADGSLGGVLIVHQPTTAAKLDFRRYINHQTSPENAKSSISVSTGVTTEAGDPDWVCDIRSARSTQAAASGKLWVPISGQRQQIQNAGGEQFVSVELRGFQYDTRIVVYDVTVFGVTG